MHHVAVVILAAGKGKRMGNPDLPKVMALLDGRPLLAHVLDQAQNVGAERIVVIVGHQRHLVEEFLQKAYPHVEFAVQAEQLGTGHAVMQTESLLGSFDGHILILSGDVPLLRSATLHDFVSDHIAATSDVSVLSCIAPDPTGYGRIVRDSSGNFERIVEHRDATEEEKKIAEINSGIYVVRAPELFAALSQVKNANAQQEYYLTDVVSILHGQGRKVTAFSSSDFQELMGINTAQELVQAESVYQHRHSNGVEPDTAL